MASAAPAFACSPGTDTNKKLLFDEPPTLIAAYPAGELFYRFSTFALKLHSTAGCTLLPLDALTITITAWYLDDFDAKTVAPFWEAFTWQSPSNPSPSDNWADPVLVTEGPLEGSAQWTGKATGTPLLPGVTVEFPDVLIGHASGDAAGGAWITASAAGWESATVEVEAIR